MDNDQMRAMYNSFGTLNRPQSYGDDLYNDRENIIRAQPMTQTGEDEVGNPIMAPVEMPEASNKPILNNVIDVVSDVVTTPGAFSGQVGPIGTMTDTVANYIMGNDEQRQQILDRMQRYTPQGIESGIKSVIHSMSNATELEHTKLYENYFYNAEKKNAEIKRIANLLQIDENAFAHNRELYQKAALAADRVERMGKFKKYQDAEGNIDMAKIYADVPGLAEVQQKQGTAAAALALGNIDGIQSINEVYDNAFSRFAGSVYAGARRGYIADRRSAIWNEARKENRLPTAEEQEKLDEYDAELRTLPKYNYNTVGNVAGAMIGGAAENAMMILKSQAAGGVAGLAGARIGGAKVGEVARNLASTYVMAQDIAGSQYEELVNKTDANGRPMYTPEQASWLALSQGVGEAVLEQWSLNQIGKAIFGRSAAKSLTEIIRTSPTIEAAKAGVRDYAALKLSEAGKAGLISLGSEAFEEFTQQASDMLMENMAQVMLKGKDADITSVEDILAASTGQMVEALPAIGGFGLIGFGMNPIANTRAVLGFRSNVRNVVNNKVLIGRMANAHYGEVLDGVWKNKGNIKELQDKAPESVTTILDTQNRLAGMEDGFVDVRELSKENADLVDQIAEANNISKDELAACLDGSGMLQVKTSTLMQMDLKDEQHKAIRDNVTTSLDAFTTAQENNAIKLVKEQMDSLQAFNDKTYKQAVENIIQARFPDAEQAKLAREIIEANYDNPQEEFKRRLDAVNAEMDEYIAPVLAELRSGMKQGVDIIRIEGDRDASYVKQSNNADWYRSWYEDYGRAPNAEELRDLAIAIASGRQNNRYGLFDYQNDTDEKRAYFEPVAETLDRLEEQRNALMAIQDRMRDLNPGEMVATASLSKEGLKVYDTMRQMMGESENKDVRKAGAFNALFLARYADNMAKAISKVRNIPYTAEDFVRDRFRIDVNAEYNEEQMAAQLFQAINEDITKMDADYLDAVKRGDMETAQRMVDEAAELADMRKTVKGKMQSGIENVVHIKDGVYEASAGKRKAGKTIDFVDAIIKGKKLGETRFTKGLPRNKWVGISRDGKTVIARVKFGDPIEISKDSKEYKDALIKGVKGYDLKDGQTKYYYPVLEVQDLRNDAREILPRTRSAKYQLKSNAPVTYDENGNVIPLSQRFNRAVPDFYRQQGRTAKGAISLTEQGQKIISLFESADQSTFVHEMAHMFLLDLQELAGVDSNSQQAKDLQTVMAWAEYKPGQADEYKGTASAEEFRKREQAIKEAEAKGDEAEARRLKDVWAQERFARAFEEYLKSGEAPAQGLKRAFRAFKKWLVQIYNDVLGAGVRATPEVEAVMARMVASEEEIDAMEAANSIARKVVDLGNMPQIAADKLKEMQNEAKEEAKERMLKRLIRDYENNNLKDLNEKLKVVRKDAREELKNLPCFVVQKLLDESLDMEAALDIGEFASEQEYKDALEQAGGTLDKAVYRAVKEAKKNILGQMPSKQQLYDMAEEALNSGIHNTEMSEIEAGIMESLKEEYNNVTAKLRRAFEEIDSTLDKEASAEMLEALKKSIRNLKYAERWGAQEFVLIKEFENAANKLDEVDREAVERLREKYEQIKEKTLRNKEWINGIIDANKGMAKVIKDEAGRRLNDETVSVATNPRYWHRQALSAAKRAWDGLRKVNKGEQIDYDNAVAAKEEQAVYDAMTAQAIKNKQQLNRWMNSMNGFLARAKRMADPKFKADPNMRYYYSHLMYVFGIRNSDGIPPTDLKPITDVLADLRASHQFEDEVPEWLISAANATEQGKDYQQLTMGQLQELKKFTDILYTLARNQNQLLTMDVSMDDVVAGCTVDYLNNVDYKVGHQKIGEVRGAIGDYMNGLLKPEVILSLLGGEKGGFIKYIYRILFDAAEAEEKAREAEAVAIRALYKAFYSKEELRAMLNDTVMTTDENGKQVPLTIGDDSNITKENLICMALNMGNSTNRARLCVGLFGVTNEQQLAMAEAEVTRILQENLTENDWKFVQAMWNHIDSFADPVSKVLEKSLGVPLDRVKREPFTVVFPDGRTMRMEGGYYPIVKDSSKSTRQTEFDQLEEAKAVGGVSVFGTGMSATKNRADNLFVDNGPLKLTLDVAHNHITAQIHLIHARMAVRDVYKVINNKAIQGMIRQTCGEGTVQSLNEWVLSCWAPPVRTRSWYENVVAKVRSKTVGAIMAYRASTALLNAANVVYMAQEIGVKNALIAMAEFYRHPSRNKQMILDVSVFMRNRASNIDRDLSAQQDSVLNRHEGVLGKLGNAVDKATGGRSEEMRYMIDKYANWMIETTDMMVSLPLYKWQFEQTYSEEIAKGTPEEEARETANFEATRRVQKVFGSSREVDRSKVQRDKNEMVKMLTPFFTFANTMMNAVWSKYYAGKFSSSERVPKVDATGKPVLDADGNQEYTTVKKDLRQRYARFVRAAFFNFVLGALVETWLRQIPNWLAGAGDDDDDEDRIGVGVLSVNKKQWGKNVIDSAAAGFPLINIATENIVSALEGRRSGGRGVGVIAGSIGRWTTVANDIVKIAQGKDSVDAIDFMRDVVRVTNIRTGMSDTITDAVFNTVRFIGDDYQLDNMDDLREYIAKTIFDRKLKKK